MYRCTVVFEILIWFFLTSDLTFFSIHWFFFWTHVLQKWQVTPCRNTMKGKTYTIKAYIEPKRQKRVIILVITSNENWSNKPAFRKKKWETCSHDLFFEGRRAVLSSWFTLVLQDRLWMPAFLSMRAHRRKKQVFYTSAPNPEHETDKVLLINCHTFLSIASRYAQTHLSPTNLGHFLVQMVINLMRNSAFFFLRINGDSKVRAGSSVTPQHALSSAPRCSIQAWEPMGASNSLWLPHTEKAHHQIFPLRPSCLPGICNIFLIWIGNIFESAQSC